MLKFNSTNRPRGSKSNITAIFRQITYLPFLSTGITIIFSIISLLTMAAYLLLANSELIYARWNENNKILLHLQNRLTNENVVKLREQLEKNLSIAKVELVKKEMVLTPRVTLLSPEEINRFETELKQLPEVTKVVMDMGVIQRNVELCKLSNIFMELLFWFLLIHWLLVIFGASYLTTKTLNRKLNIAKNIIPKQFIVYGLGSGVLAVAGIRITELVLRNHDINFSGLGTIESMVAVALPAIVAYLAAKTVT